MKFNEKFFNAVDKAFIERDGEKISLGHIFGYLGKYDFKALMQAGYYKEATESEKRRVKRYFSQNGEFNPDSEELKNA